MKGKINYPILLITSLVLVHLYLALRGISVGWHPDEWRITLETLAMGQSRSIISQSVNYPLFFRYLLLIIFGGWYLIGYAFKIFHSSADFALLFFNNPSLFLMIPRIVNVIIGCATIILTYFVGKKIFNKKTGVVAAVFSAVEYQLFSQSLVGLHQSLAALSTLPIFYFLNSYLYKPTKRNLYLLSIFTGIGASIHHTTILFLPVILIVLIINLKKTSFGKNLHVYLIAFFLGIFFSILGNLNWIFHFQESLRFLHLGEDVSKIAFSSHQFFSYTIPSFFLWFFSELTKQDYVLGFLMFISSLTFVIKREKKYLIIFIFFITYNIYFYNWAYRWLHILIGIIPIMTIFAADLAISISDKVNKKFVYVIIPLITIPSVISIISLTIDHNKIDTRTTAVDWIENNIPVDDNIAIDWSAYSPIIPSTPPVYLLNPTAKDFFNNSLPEELKNKLSGKAGTYNIVESIYQTAEPVWPNDMPKDEIERAKKYYIYSDLYKYYNFVSTQELSEILNSKYLVITSYTYTMFLYDDSPYKKDLFDIYGKDNILSFQSQTKDKSANERHRLLSYLMPRAQNFYLPLLENNDKYYYEIKRFSPNNDFSGPDVIIYKQR